MWLIITIGLIIVIGAMALYYKLEEVGTDIWIAEQLIENDEGEEI